MIVPNTVPGLVARFHNPDRTVTDRYVVAWWEPDVPDDPMLEPLVIDESQGVAVPASSFSSVTVGVFELVTP